MSRPLTLSTMFQSPALRAAFGRIERDASGALVIADAPKPVLMGGATERILEDA